MASLDVTPRCVLNGERVTLKDLGSANGTYCNGTRISDARVLTDGDKISMGGTTILKFTYQDDLDEQFSQNLYESAVRDGLTGLYNRRYFDDRLRAELAFASRHRAAARADDGRHRSLQAGQRRARASDRRPDAA